MVEPFPWSDAFAVGDEALDAEHRRMVGLINDICIAAATGRRSSLGSLLGELQLLAEMHFRNEEVLLTRIASEIDQQHLKTVMRNAIEQDTREHRRQLEELRELNKLQESSTIRNGDLKLCDALKTWFVTHAVGYEAQVKTILQSSHHLRSVRA